jgi:DNA-binding NtrC family response regulator
MMVDFYKQIARIADSSASVLIEGESGTGKELTARSLHNMSSRREKPFIIVHCGAIPDNLLESELFGYNKGAYTAPPSAHGHLETPKAHGILDEITEMSTALQGKLSAFHAKRRTSKNRDKADRNFEVVLSRCQKKKDDEVKKRIFASIYYTDLFAVALPPLREHKEDIPLLTEALLKKLGDTNVSVSPDAMEMFMGYDWPGNVRELENVLQQIMLLSPFDEILPENLPERFHSSTDRKDILNGPGLSPLEEAEKEKILQTLKETSWNQSQAAKRLDIDRKTLRTKIRRYSLS